MKKCVLIYLISLAKSLIVFTKKQQQTVEFVLLLGFTIMAAEETPYLPGPWEINQPFVMWHLKNELGLWSLWSESLVQIISFFSVNISSVRFKPKAHWKTNNSPPCLNTHQKRAWFATDKSRKIIVKHFKSKSVIVTSIMPNYRWVGLIWSITDMAKF